METLAQTLRQHGVNTASLAVLYQENDITLYHLTLLSNLITAQWRALRQIAPLTGHWPVIIGNDTDLEFFTYYVELRRKNTERYPQHDTSIPAFLARGQTLDLQQWFAKQNVPFLAEAEASPGMPDFLNGIDPVLDPSLLDEGTADRPYLFRGDEGKPLHIALLPTLVSWEIPAYLKFGGFNACPFPDEHVAVFKHWHDLVGIQVMIMTHDRIQLGILRPPQDRALALDLAREHFRYSEEYTDQDTLERCAAKLMRQSTWHFWWD